MCWGRHLKIDFRGVQGVPQNGTHPVQFGIFPSRLLLPYTDDEILAGYEEDASSIRDGRTALVKVDPASSLERHLINFKQCQSHLS